MPPFSYRLLSEDVKINIQKIILAIVLYGCESRSYV
jgi:hypothetical protein